MQIAKLFFIIITGAALLGGCAPGITEVDWAAHAYEYAQRETCRKKCRYTAYADAVKTECYGDCMLKRGFFCTRNFGTYLDNFECVISRPLPDEYQPGGSKWKAHKEYSKCVKENVSVFSSSSRVKECEHLLPEPPDTEPRFYTE